MEIRLVALVPLMSLLSAGSPQSLAVRQPGERLRPGDRRAGPREDLQVSPPFSPSTFIHPSVSVCDKRSFFLACAAKHAAAAAERRSLCCRSAVVLSVWFHHLVSDKETSFDNTSMKAQRLKGPIQHCCSVLERCTGRKCIQVCF